MDFLSPILDQVRSLLLNEYSRIHGISGKLQLWAEKLPGIQALLDSAEEKQMNDDDPATVQWLADLRDVAYDMEDLLDHVSVDAKQKASKKRPFSLISKLSQFDPRTLISGHRMANEIEDVDRRLKAVHDQIPSLQLVRNSRSESRDDLPRFRTTSLPEPKFVGRKTQMKELLARLTRSEGTRGSVRPFTVVSIVGMGGLGKTTLAQELFNHKSLKNADFMVNAWVCVSEVFDMAAITKSILDKVAPSSSGTEKDLDQLQNSLKEKLSRKKFLLVLDDVWNDNYDELESLMKPLYSGSEESRVLVTTRNIDVARRMGDRDPEQLELLSSKDCLSLLAYHSIGEENFEQHPNLQDIAVELANKCKGLPLSIKAIGGLLRFERDDEQWKRVLTRGCWDREGRIPPALKLSYIHLPIRLKRCFAACALFPKDYVFDQDELIRLWIIQGLLQKGTTRTFREVGMENIRRLEALSFLQKARYDKTRYSMHDLINDLAKSVDACSYFSSDERKEGFTPSEVSLDKVRHAAMVTKWCEMYPSRRLDVYRTMKKLRTFMPFQISKVPKPPVFVSEDVIQELIVDMKCLKMLSLRYFQITQVPDWIGELKLLRSVDFSHTNIQMLPESICDLVELQSLLLRGCEDLTKLPRNIYKLTNLLHLDITGTKNLQEMPSNIGDLTNLEILSDFVVGKEVGQELRQLGPLGCLQRELHIHKLMDVVDVEDGRIANLPGKEAILELSLYWGSSSEISHEDDHQFKILHHLQPPRRTESLAIGGYGAKRFPSWFDNHCCMKNVLSITLTGCTSVVLLPPFGQLPRLERLDISGLGAISSIGPEFYGSRRPCFQSLTSLHFKDMGAWEKWTYHGEDKNDQPFPCLHHLNVRKCPKLKGGCTLSLTSLIKIEIDGCDGGLLKCLVGLTSMTEMDIRNIPELVHFEGSLSTSWAALEVMNIMECPRFKSFMEGHRGKRVPPNLKVLQITSCGEFEKLPEELSELTSLNEMSIVGCEKLCSFPSGGLPASLRKLELLGCPKMPQSQLINSGLLESLEDVSLSNLGGFVSISELVDVGSPLIRSLGRLEISNCNSLTTFPDGLQHMSALSHLTLGNCPALEMEIFPSLPCNLSSFVLYSCPKVKSLPHDMHHLTSLKSLSIFHCNDITRLAPRGGMPPSLEFLWIAGCRNLNHPIEEWGLRGLTALRKLMIRGEMGCVDEMVCIPPPADDDREWSRLLPSSLVHLDIGGMKKLERVGGGLRHHLTSLQYLNISNCERLRCLPDDGLPDSLESLYISGCTEEELVEKCRKGKGEYWHSHLRLIPRVDIAKDVV